MDWKAYMKASLTPDFHWAVVGAASSERGRTPSSKILDLHAAGLRLALSVETLQFEAGGIAAALPGAYGAGSRTVFSPQAWTPASRHLLSSRFESDRFTPTLNTVIGASVDAHLGVVIASQRFATAGFGQSSVDAQSGALVPGARSEWSSGQGMHVGFAGPALPDLRWQVAAQTQIDMDAFKSYRGVYSEPGDFDVPGRVSAQLAWLPSDVVSVSASVDRVFYSDVEAFTSGALPARFLALLGDSSSPSFAWQDLTVFAMEGTVRDRFDGQWSMRYTTRQQPSPTSQLLDMALAEDYTDLNLSAAYRRSFANFGQLALGASYAPSQYFLGVSPYGRSYQPGRQLEVELNWTVAF